MFWHNIPDDAQLTTGQLGLYSLRCLGRQIPLSLHEEASALVSMGQRFPREDYWIWLPEEQNESPRSLTLAGHQLQRTDENPLWQVSPNYVTVDFTRPGQWVETLTIRPTEEDSGDPGLNLIFRRYEATHDPDAEKAEDCHMITNRLTGDGEVVGVRGYREKLYIPGIVEGKTVTRVNLPYWSRSKYLRELIIEEGTGPVFMDFDCETLETIRLPDDTPLAAPPVGILNTAWFRAQPPGDVYFCGYYCGTRGKAPSPVLRVREGTLGILDNAYGGDGLQQVILPISIAYIGENAFAGNKELTWILLPESAGDLSPALERRGCLTEVYPGSSTAVRPVRKNPGELTGWDLYALGRTARAQARIPAACEPLAPKLTYESGWIAHYYYSREGKTCAAYLLSVAVPSGTVVHKARFSPPDGSDAPRWSKHRAPAHYHWAAEYLAECARMVSGGEPTQEQLRQLESKWIQIHPDRLKNSLYDLEKEHKTLTGIRKKPSLPTKAQRPGQRKWKRILIGKKGISTDP